MVACISPQIFAILFNKNQLGPWDLGWLTEKRNWKTLGGKVSVREAKLMWGSEKVERQRGQSKAEEQPCIRAVGQEDFGMLTGSE